MHGFVSDVLEDHGPEIRLIANQETSGDMVSVLLQVVGVKISRGREKRIEDGSR